MNLIECIEHYFDENKSYMEGLLEELNKQHELNNKVSHLEAILSYYKEEILYSIDKLEIHCRALRDKLENG